MGYRVSVKSRTPWGLGRVIDALAGVLITGFGVLLLIGLFTGGLEAQVAGVGLIEEDTAALAFTGVVIAFGSLLLYFALRWKPREEGPRAPHSE